MTNETTPCHVRDADVSAYVIGYILGIERDPEFVLTTNTNNHVNLHEKFEIIVVNDDSTDDTLSRTIDYFNLRRIDVEINMQVECQEIRGVYGSFVFPNLVMVDKANGGKADALNAGINLSRYPLFCGIDADCIIEKNALLRIVKPFLTHRETIASQGNHPHCQWMHHPQG